MYKATDYIQVFVRLLPDCKGCTLSYFPIQSLSPLQPKKRKPGDTSEAGLLRREQV